MAHRNYRFVGLICFIGLMGSNISIDESIMIRYLFLVARFQQNRANWHKRMKPIEPN